MCENRTIEKESEEQGWRMERKSKDEDSSFLKGDKT